MRTVCCLFLAASVHCYIPTTTAKAQLFDPSVEYGVGAHPRSIAIGDLDGDGVSDLATANDDSDDVSVLLGNGDGTFQTAIFYGAGLGQTSVVIGDLDGDSNQDLVTVSGVRSNVSVLLGNGDGTFQAAVNYGVGLGSWSVASKDLDGNGTLDLATANLVDNSVSVLINTTAQNTVSAEITCLPPLGMLPFTTQMSVTLENLYTEQTRRFAARIDVTTGDDHLFTNWRAGYVGVPAGYSYITSWSQNLPVLDILVGPNRFDLIVEDVTPAPFNQSPYPPSGANDMTYCTVTGIMP